MIKVSVVGGLRRSARLCRLAGRLGAKAVLSSAFESGVGLAHASILASCFATHGRKQANELLPSLNAVIGLRADFLVLVSSSCGSSFLSLLP